MTTTTISVEGMTCGHCTASVTEALTDVAGVTSVTVSLDPPHARVEHTPDFDEKTARAAIREVGYSVAQ